MGKERKMYINIYNLKILAQRSKTSLEASYYQIMELRIIFQKMPKYNELQKRKE